MLGGGCLCRACVAEAKALCRGAEEAERAAELARLVESRALEVGVPFWL